ncbi:MAG: peptidase M61 [Bacteroidetes bacterium]|nr:peptidase M61 [Bacteroidota bacterium]
MRSILFLFILTVFNSFSSAQVNQDNSYRFFVDMNNVEDDRLTVELITPKFSEQSVSYKFPAMVPGTYKVYNFGKYISDFKAEDESGNSLNVSKGDVNTWIISDADKLYKISYKADDTFDDTVYQEKVFEPVGTNINKGVQFVFNNQGFFGYFDGYSRDEYVMTFIKPEGFYGSTSLDAVKRENSEDVFISPDYQFLVDNPIMYTVPDTTSINFDEAKIMVSVYSQSKGITSKDIAESNEKLLIAIRKFLGGKLPADKYTFIYNFSSEGNSGNYGALEHNLSSFYHFPDIPIQAKPFMIKQLMSTSAHEFYHTVTPLNLHSEEIGIFDFNNPVMSKHLWMYEGSTEYFADYIQLREGLMDLKEYMKSIEGKINSSMNYNDSLPFTVMSKGALDEYESQYNNVYLKGALIGLCLDILIRETTDGKMEYQDVINRLLEKYGKDRSFKDDDLFDDIEALTNHKVREFLDTYVSGPNRIPYEEFLGKIGMTVKKDSYQSIAMGGGLQMGFDQKTYRLKIAKLENENNAFIKELGLKQGDELISVNGNPINFMNIKEAFGSAKKQIKKGDKIDIVVARYDDSGKENQVNLSAIVPETKTSYDYEISISDNPTAEQKKLLSEWSGK